MKAISQKYLFLIVQSENSGYDTYDSAVVCCKSVEEARNIDPSGGDSPTGRQWTSPSNVTVVPLGLAMPHIEHGVVCASFNAG